MTDGGGVLNVGDLRRACSLLLDEAERRFGAEIDLHEISVDLYWNIDLRAALEMVNNPQEHLDCGQIHDDLAELTALLRSHPTQEPVLWHDLQHLTGLLRLLAFMDLPAHEAPTT